VYYRKAAFCCPILVGGKDSTEDIYKEMFPAYGGKCLSGKAVHKRVVKLSQGRLKVADDARPGVEVTETTVKRLVFSGFDAW
jgi:hypothetical protein